MKSIGSGNKIFSVIFMVVGLFLLLVAIFPLIVPVIFVFLGLYLINYGMKLRGLAPLSLYIKAWWFGRTFR